MSTEKVSRGFGITGGKGHKQRIGEIGEQHALSFLRKKGLRFVERNWRCSLGEIDLIFVDGDQLVVVEVKTRLDSKLAEQYIFMNITAKKKQKLRILSEIYFRRLHEIMGLNTLRIDVVGIILSPRDYKVVTVQHLAAAL